VSPPLSHSSLSLSLTAVNPICDSCNQPLARGISFLFYLS
jgi:hypothetical protein